MGIGLSCRRLGFVHHPGSPAERTVLDQIDVDFRAGELTLITGDTGVGKTTLLHILAGIRRPSTGTVEADGRPVSRWVASHRDRWRREVGVVFQAHHLLGDLTVLDNVILPLIPRVSSCRRLHTRAMHILERLRLSHLADRAVARLSGGERQRVAIARAIVPNPRYLLADEPTAHQDRSSVDWVLQLLIHAAAASNSTVIITAHDPRMASADAIDRAFRLADGKLTERR